jgi:YggT family protein
VTALPPPVPKEPDSPDAAKAEVEDETSPVKKYLGAMSPRSVWSMADGYPVVLKQFVQFCLIIIYPAWLFGVLFLGALHLLFYVTVYPVLWVLFWPMRAYQKKHHPKDYAESQRAG